MMRSSNIMRGPAATLVLLTSLWTAAIAHAQSAALPAPAGVAQAYSTLRAWTDAFELPRPDDVTARVPIDGARGVCVIVRRSGRMLGSGSDVTGDDLMLRRATSQALGEVLADATVASLSKDVRDAIGPSLTIELEVAGEMSPLIGSTLPQMAVRIEPGLDGVALRRGQELLAMFPSHMRATNTAGDPAARLLALSVRVGLNAEDLSNLARRTDVAAYGFRTVHLIQPAPGRPPIQTFRGDVLVPMSAVDRQAIIGLSNGLADHLLASVWPDPVGPATQPDFAPPLGEAPPRQPLGMMGNYQPYADAYEPLVAPVLDQALCAIALQHYAESPAIAKDKALAASAGARMILKDLANVVEGEADPFAEPAACAAMVFAIVEQPSIADDEVLWVLLDRAAAGVVACFDSGAGFAHRTDAEGIERPMSPHSQALVAGAMCKLLALKDQRPQSAAKLDAKLVRAALERAWQSVPRHQQAALLPWIGWAEIDFTRATGKALSHGDDLRLMREALERSGIGEESAAAPDLVGGLNLTASGADMAEHPRADAQTIRPAAWLAGLIRDERFTPPGRAESALARQLPTMRFLVQLSTRSNPGAVLATFRNPKRAAGGLRAAPWDWDEPLPAQALALVTAVQMLQAMDESVPPAKAP